MAKQKPAEELITQSNDEAVVEDYTDRLDELAAILAAELAALEAQDPTIYRYNGNAAAGESMAHVPLADIRASLWAELEPYMQASVAESPLFTKVEVANG